MQFIDYHFSPEYTRSLQSVPYRREITSQTIKQLYIALGPEGPAEKPARAGHRRTYEAGVGGNCGIVVTASSSGASSASGGRSANL